MSTTTHAYLTAKTEAMTDKELVLQALETIKARIAENIQTKQRMDGRGGIEASGRTRKSLVVKSTTTGGVLEGRGYFDSLERGAGPAPRGTWFYGVIRQWIVDKGITAAPIPYKRKPSERWQPKYTPEERGLTYLAGCFATSIINRGTVLHRMGGRADIYSDIINEEIDNLSEQLAINIEQRIKDNTI